MDLMVWPAARPLLCERSGRQDTRSERPCGWMGRLFGLTWYSPLLIARYGRDFWLRLVYGAVRTTVPGNATHAGMRAVPGNAAHAGMRAVPGNAAHAGMRAVPGNAAQRRDACRSYRGNHLSIDLHEDYIASPATSEGVGRPNAR